MSSPSPRGVVVVGAGGHAKVVISTLQEAGIEIAALVDDDPGKVGETLLGVRVVGLPAERLSGGAPRAVIAVGDNPQRRAVAERFPHVEWCSVVHPRAFMHPSVRLGPGTVVFAGAIIQPDTRIGPHVIVNTGATVDHDCEIGGFVHIAPGVHLSGGVTVGEGALLGIGSCVRPGGVVGSWATVGAGAAVVGTIPDGVVAVGVPARARR
jgi:sugar O-acyltransferase (sialic acid O-acetyltransferase NeuD family)